MAMLSRRTMLQAAGGSASVGAALASNSGQPAKLGTYRLSRDIPVEAKYDLLVAGGGPGGSAAAIAAARLGAKVLLVEGTGCLGGMATSGMMMSFCPVADGEKCLTGGLMLEWIETLHKRGFLKPGIQPDAWRKRYGSWVPFNAEGLKLLLDELAVSSGVETRFFTHLIDADADARTGQVRGAIIHNIEGYRYVKAGAFIDATGNGVMAKLCGAKCRDAGTDTPGIMPPTLISLFAGIDWARMGDQQVAMKKALAENFFSQPDRHFPGMQQIGNHIGLLNGGHLFHLDALREKSMTDGMMKGRRLAQEFIAFYRKYVPGCENVEHVTTAPLMGLRESRCVLGEYELGLSDYNARRKFPDQIGVYNYPIDIHVYDTSDQQYARYSKEFRETGRMKPGESVGLPYGMIVPKGFKNLWVAGRCASMDVQVHGAFRVQPAAVMMGQAAGTAAVQSVRTKRSAAEIDTELLVETLRKAGAYLPQSATSKQMSRKTA
ncbi:MAG TPA: FAD-dependent oxidoreductase [Bryobacteraceae bacterium]|nr:FAD-dependent oxidoreductase [Bryobacteraceae bacterium]